MENTPVRRRRAKGEGSLYQRKDGRWAGRASIGFRLVPQINPDGTPGNPRRVARHKTVYSKTKGDAAAKLRQILVKYNPKYANEILISECLDNWLEDGVDRWRVATYKNYETWSRLHVAPYLGAMKVIDITADDVRNWQRELTDKGVTAYTRMRAHKLMIQLYNDLTTERRVSWNPFKAVKPAKAPAAKIYVPSPEDLQRLIGACPNEQVRTLVILAATTMLRIGELLALRLQDIDMEKGRVSVTATLSENWHGVLTRGEPKTASSRRVLSLPQVAIEAIQQHLRARKLLGLGPCRWLFSTSEGGVIERHNFRSRIWLPLVQSAGLPKNMHFHALRHAGNSLLLDAGVPVLVIAARCGHADTRMTMDRYGHIIRAGADKEAASITDRIFRNILSPEE